MTDNTHSKPKLLIFLQWYTPAHKAGGPIRSIQNLVALMSDDFDMYIYASDRDMKDKYPLEGIIFNTWIQKEEGYRVFYADRKYQSGKAIRKQLELIRPGVIYFNSMYAYRYFLLPLIVLSRIKYTGRIILAPRGMLKATAIKFKSTKKQIFLWILRHQSWLRQVYFHATDQQERNDIVARLRVDPKRITVLQNIPFNHSSRIPIEKKGGQVRLIFVGRIHPIKGLDFLLSVLQSMRDQITLNIVGWIEDQNYFLQCMEKTRLLPREIKVNIIGGVPLSHVIGELQQSHFLVLPTHGENFGHAIFESMAIGRPVIISDETPWRHLEQQKAGWDISLNAPDQFVNHIKQAVSMDQDEYDQWSTGAFQYATTYLQSQHLKEAYQSLLGQ